MIIIICPFMAFSVDVKLIKNTVNIHALVDIIVLWSALRNISSQAAVSTLKSA